MKGRTKTSPSPSFVRPSVKREPKYLAKVLGLNVYLYSSVLCSALFCSVHLVSLSLAKAAMLKKTALLRRPIWSPLSPRKHQNSPIDIAMNKSSSSSQVCSAFKSIRIEQNACFSCIFFPSPPPSFPQSCLYSCAQRKSSITVKKQFYQVFQNVH